MSYFKKDVPVHILREAAWNLFNYWDPTGELLKKCTEGFEPDKPDDSVAANDASGGHNRDHESQSVSTPRALRAHKRRLTRKQQTFEAITAASQAATAMEHVTGGLLARIEQTRRQPTELKEGPRRGHRGFKKPRLEQEQTAVAQKAVLSAVAVDLTESPTGVPTAIPIDRSAFEKSASKYNKATVIKDDDLLLKVPLDGSAHSHNHLHANDPPIKQEGTSTPNPALIDIIAERLLQPLDYEVQIMDARQCEQNDVTLGLAAVGFAAVTRPIDSPRVPRTVNKQAPSVGNNAENRILDEVSQCLEILLEAASQANDLPPNPIPLESAETFSPLNEASANNVAQQVVIYHADNAPRRFSPPRDALKALVASIDKPLDEDGEAPVAKAVARSLSHILVLSSADKPIRDDDQIEGILPNVQDGNHAEDKILDEEVSQCLDTVLDNASPSPTYNGTRTEEVSQVHLPRNEDCSRRSPPQIHFILTQGASTDETVDVMLLEMREEQHRCAERFSELQSSIKELIKLKLKSNEPHARRTPLIPHPGDVHRADAPLLTTIVTTAESVHEDAARIIAMQHRGTMTDGATIVDGGQAQGTLDPVIRLALDLKHQSFPQNVSDEELLRHVLTCRSLVEKYDEALEVLQVNLEKKA
ncbi:hypothetical protein AAVH_18563 [Aphelenchoides avenae]|nr:hypothetical protein AAVH_18563 [Aphelenchus avenae]